jgi:hypothetical protein
MYFGEIDGRKTEETVRALRHYQERKGFKTTGEPDGDTLAALNLAPVGPAAQPWPEVAVLKSDAARAVGDEDRKKLESLDVIREGPEEADREAPAVANPPPPDAPVVLARERAEDFVRKYLRACETNDLAAEMAFYATPMRYFDHGLVDRAFVERDVAAFYKRWPERSYELLDFKIVRQRGDETVARFRIHFRYRGAEHNVAGTTDNIFTIQHIGEQQKFVTLQERRLRE